MTTKIELAVRIDELCRGLRRTTADALKIILAEVESENATLTAERDAAHAKGLATGHKNNEFREKLWFEQRDQLQAELASKDEQIGRLTEALDAIKAGLREMVNLAYLTSEELRNRANSIYTSLEAENATPPSAGQAIGEVGE